MSSMDELVEQVQELENATTDLLDATNVSKQTLDEAVDSAKGSAGSAKTDAGTATSARNEAVTARNESVKAKDDAEAIVYDGEATTTPTGGAIPVAYSDGHIDSGWTPLLTAMYPYSGVIGSVDKGDMFTFYTSQGASWANRVDVKARQFNINGRFVDLPATTLTLPEAEDTAERAVAFDDIFLDWNGNIDTYRSITPHRTSTGYDSDAIATEHGYTKVQTGLYQTGDTYALLLGRVARRNKGGYHPLWNPEGTGSHLFPDAGNQLSRTWYASDARKTTSTAECFDFGEYSGDSGFIRIDSGNINQNVSARSRPDDARYDAIYSDDFTPLYYSAKNVVDRQALLFDSFNKAVAGETFMGAESTAITGLSVTPDSSSTSLYVGIGSRLAPDGMQDGDKLVIVIESTGGATLRDGIEVNTPYECEAFFRQTALPLQSYRIRRLSDGIISWISDGNTTTLSIRVFHKKAAGFRYDSKRPQFLAVDIIGSLDAMPQEWLDNCLPGNWLAVGEEGEDLIPDGTEKVFKASRKVLENYLVLKTTDSGATWSDETTTWKTDLESAANARTDTIPATDAYMLFYHTAANTFELANNTEFLSLYRHPLAVNGAFSMASDNSIGAITANMIGKVPVSSSRNYIGDSEAYGFRYFGKSSGGITQKNRLHDNRNFHEPFDFHSFGAINPCAKHLPLLVGNSNKMFLHVIYKELKHDGDSWGDDNRFNAVSNQFTETDLNGEQVIVGQKRVALPYHFDGVTL